MTMKVLPTKTELLEKNIVDIDQHHKRVITNTLQIADYFNKRPSEINRRILALGKKGLCRIAPSYYLNQQGKQQKYYELNRDEFLLVVLGFTGDKADQFKANLIQLFNQLETELLHWREQASLTKDSTKQANEQVHRLKTALTEVIPTSKRCKMLYIHLQQAITKAATGSAKTLRTTMSTSQLKHIQQLEALAHEEIELRMNQGIAPIQVRDDVLAMIKTTGKKEALVISDQTNEKGFLNINNDNNAAGVFKQSSPEN